MKTEEEFDIFYVDMNRLEDQAAEHTFLYIQYCKQLKDAKEDLNKEKSKLDLVAAEQGLLIGRRPDRYDLPVKPTAKAIQDTVLTRPKYRKAHEEYMKVQDLVSSLQIYVNAFEHRKRMISKAIDLHGQAYFAKPHIAHSEVKEVVDMLEKKRLRSPIKSKKKMKKKR